jgi:glutamine amidotransferase
MQTVAVLDYGMSNLRSVVRALESVAENRHRIEVTDDPARLPGADRIVFPGQGAIGQCMINLARTGLDRALLECLESKPYLGICLGLQCLMDRSEENGGTGCFGVIAGDVLHFPAGMNEENGTRCKIPHMGWNRVRHAAEHALWKGIEPGERFYFVHSYYVRPAADSDIAGSTAYGISFASAVARDNLFAVQFHPEKSQRAGLALLRNFLDWNP